MAAIAEVLKFLSVEYIDSEWSTYQLWRRNSLIVYDQLTNCVEGILWLCMVNLPIVSKEFLDSVSKEGIQRKEGIW